MSLPHRIPGLRVATLLLAVYGLIWIPLEGDLRRVTVLGVWATAVAILTIMQRWLGGRTLPMTAWLGAASLAGVVAGAGSALLTLFLMALKTGLHGHGPEFTPQQIAWVWGQLPVWALAGGLIGLGGGLITAALARRRV